MIEEHKTGVGGAIGIAAANVECIQRWATLVHGLSKHHSVDHILVADLTLGAVTMAVALGAGAQQRNAQATAQATGALSILGAKVFKEALARLANAPTLAAQARAAGSVLKADIALVQEVGAGVGNVAELVVPIAGALLSAVLAVVANVKAQRIGAIRGMRRARIGCKGFLGATRAKAWYNQSH